MWGFDRVGVVSVCNEGALSSGRVGNVCSGVCVSVCVCVCVSSYFRWSLIMGHYSISKV